MPYKRVGKCVYKADTGKKVGCSKSIPEAKAYLNKLNMVHAGVPPKNQRKGK